MQEAIDFLLKVGVYAAIILAVVLLGVVFVVRPALKRRNARRPNENADGVEGESAKDEPR